MAENNKTATAPPGTATADPRRWKALGVLAIVQLMLLLDATVVNVALPSIKSDLQFSESGLTWVVSAYLLAAGGLLLLGGKIADLIGRRRVFIFGTVLFAIASVIAGAAQTSAMLIVGRVLQGAAEGLVAPAALSMVALLFTNSTERAKAFSIWASLAGLGSTLGVLFSGVLTDLASWRWIFYINIIFVVAALVLIRLVVDESKAPEGRRIDVPGAVLVTAGLVALMQAILAASTHPLGSTIVVVPLVIGVALLAAFVVVESRTDQPLLPLRFFGDRTRVTGYVTVVANASTSAAVFFILVLYMQNVLGYTPLQAGLAWLPFCLAFMPGLFFSMTLMQRAGVRVTLAVGLVVSAIGVLLLSRVPVDGVYVVDLLPAMIVTSLGFAITAPAMQNAATHALTAEDAGLGAGVVTTVQQMGQALGLTVFVTVALARTSAVQASTASSAATAGYQIAFLVAAAALVIGAVVAPLILRRSVDEAVVDHAEGSDDERWAGPPAEAEAKAVASDQKTSDSTVDDPDMAAGFRRR